MTTGSKTIYSLGHVALLLLLFTGVVHAAVFPLDESGGDLVGADSSVLSSYEDTFIEIGRANNLGFEELRMANPDVDPWLPGEGREIVLPTRYILPAGKRQGIVINVAEYRIYYFYAVDGVQFVSTVPASVGRMDWETPVGATGIVAKAHKPNWYPPESVRAEHAAEGDVLPRVVPAGPDNPLGDYALRLGLPGYLIHGTNKPAGIGMQVTHGCIRLLPEDIAWLFPRVDLQTPVRLINEPLKFGWIGDELFLEVHRPLAAAGDGAAEDMTLITRAYVAATGSRSAEVDWGLVAQVYKAQTGVPVSVGRLVPPVEAEVLSRSD